MTATQPQAEEKPKANGKGAPVLMPERMGLAESKRHDWVVDAEYGLTLQQILEPSYWAHVAQQMVPGDHVEVRAEDFSWIAFLIVVFSERTYAKVVVDRVLTLDAPLESPVASIKNKVEWKGPFHKFCVIRLADSQTLQSGFKSRHEAESWMQNHERGTDR